MKVHLFRILFFTSILFFQGILGSVLSYASDPKLSEESVIVATGFGEIELGLYPEIAPGHVKQIKTLVEAGAFDTVGINRIHPDFLIQFSNLYFREIPANEKQKQLMNPIKAEFSDLKHKAWTLTMARQDNDVNSARMSFSILLADSPHLDGKYTIFGRVLAGFEVVQRIVLLGQTYGKVQEVPYYIKRAFIIKRGSHQLKAFDAEKFRSYYNKLFSLKQKRESEVQEGKILLNSKLKYLYMGVVFVMIVLLFINFNFQSLGERNIRSINLLSVLILGFMLFKTLLGFPGKDGMVSLFLFLMLVSIFRLMGQFEGRSKPKKEA
jgi:cyclophilin family peptidyl-prolyl cis-trans isomerase